MYATFIVDHDFHFNKKEHKTYVFLLFTCETFCVVGVFFLQFLVATFYTASLSVQRAHAIRAIFETLVFRARTIIY